MGARYTTGRNRLEGVVAPNLPLTMSAWVKREVSDAADSLVNLSPSSNWNKYYWMILETDTLKALISNAITPQIAIHGTTMSLDVWYHVATTFTTSRRDTYLNGIIGTTPNTVVMPNNFPTKIEIGIFSQGVAPVFHQFEGTIANLAIWESILTDEQILALANQISPFQIRPIPNWFYPLNAKNSDGSVDDMVSGLNIPFQVTKPQSVDAYPVFGPIGLM